MADLIDHAVTLLREGRLVAFPTETVYGLGADATNKEAVEGIFRAKGRPSTNPLIVHVAGVEQAKRYAGDWPETAARLATYFWPGPLTIVVPRHSSIVPQVSAGLDTVGLRSPRHPIALELLRRFDGPIAAPSANRSNRVSPTTAQHVRDELGDHVDLILDGGECDVGIESTVLSLCTPVPTILRPGHITREQLQSIIGDVAVSSQVASESVPATSPGQHLIHYSPVAPCMRFEGWPDAYGFLLSHPDDLIMILSLQQHAVPSPLHHLVPMPHDPDGYARHLYAALRSADARKPAAILTQLPPDSPPWVAVRDRLSRATRPL